VAEPVNPRPGESRIPGEVARPRIPLKTIAALAVIVALSGVGVSGAGWVVGVTGGVITNVALARGLSRYRCDRLGPADWVTLARATLAIGVAGLVADSFHQPVPVTMLVSLAVIALALDAVDGWVARRTRTTGMLGARFDAEVDAFLILILSVYVARSAGAWVLAIGAARYLPSRSDATCGGCGGTRTPRLVERRRVRPPPSISQSPLPPAPDAHACEQVLPQRSRPSPCCSSGSPSSLRTTRLVSRRARS
jgi:hypothetical protein